MQLASAVLLYRKYRLVKNTPLRKTDPAYVFFECEIGQEAVPREKKGKPKGRANCPAFSRIVICLHAARAVV